MSRAIELTDEIKEYLEQYYPDEHFPNLYEASKALLNISKDQDEDEGDEDEGDEIFEEAYNKEPAPPMTELDKLIQGEERYLQMESLLQNQEIKLQKLEKELEEEIEDVSNGSDHVKQGQAITHQDIQRQFAEMMLQIKEKKEVEALKQLA